MDSVESFRTHQTFMFGASDQTLSDLGVGRAGVGQTLSDLGVGRAGVGRDSLRTSDQIHPGVPIIIFLRSHSPDKSPVCRQ